MNLIPSQPPAERAFLLALGAILLFASLPAPASETFETRRGAFLESLADRDNLEGAMAQLELGRTPKDSSILGRFDSIDERRDCADFRTLDFCRVLHQFGISGRLSDEVLAEVRRALLGFKYWPDEPGIDSMCTWTENHQISFAASGYLIGQWYRDEVFANSGWTGAEQMERHRSRILRWLDLRYRTGFSEWLSNVYYPIDMKALLVLADFAEDEEIRRKAVMVLDTMLLDLALNSFKGVFGSTHGRSYSRETRFSREGTGDIFRFLFDETPFEDGGMDALCFALSENYRVPTVIRAIAGDGDRAEMTNRQRMGIRLDEAERWGLAFDNFEDGMVYLSLEAYAHPRNVELTVRMLDAFSWWENKFLEGFKEERPRIEQARKLGALPALVASLQKDVGRNTREEVQIYTHKAPDFMLSSAQDYRKGFGGDQHHIWQATLGPGAVCFTTQPARERSRNVTPGYWTGNGWLPRVAQFENVLISIYDFTPGASLTGAETLPMTHAWFPRDSFDEVIERESWSFARKGEGYLALRSQAPVRAPEEGEHKNSELIADGTQNIWICEMGRAETDGSFPEFIKEICGAEISYGSSGVRYRSPSQGVLEFGWNTPALKNGEPVSLGDYPRYENPYSRAEFPANRIEVRLGADRLELDWEQGTRTARGYFD